MPIQAQHFQMNFKEVKIAGGKIKIRGFASTPGLDRYDDIVQPTAFANAMKTYMANPVVLLGHDSDKPIGSVVEYNISPEGLEVVAEIVNNTDDVFEKIQNKTLRGFSIGWICNDCIYREEGSKQIREVTALDLVEISVVATPANPQTLFTLAKSLKKFFAERKEEEEVIEEAPEVTPVAEEETKEETKTDEEVVAEIATPIEEAPAPEEEVVDSEEAPVVKADEEPTESTEEVLTEEEAKALIVSIMEDVMQSKMQVLIDQNKELKNALDELQTKHDEVARDLYKIEIRPGQISEKKSAKVLTYSMI